MNKNRISKWLIAIFIVGLCVSATASEIYPDSHNRITVLTYNIHHGEGVDKKLDLGRIARVIKAASPDIVALQEVDKKTARTNKVDQAQTLAGLTGMSFVYGASMDYDGGQYGNAVLTRLDIESHKCIPLPGEPRSALCVTVKKSRKNSPDIRFDFIATHLDTHRKPRRASVPLIEKFFETHGKRAAILAGDLNATPESPTMRALAENWLDATSGLTRFTFPVRVPTRQIDYVLFRPTGKWKTINSKVLEEGTASDHRPLLVVLEWRAEVPQH